MNPESAPGGNTLEHLRQTMKKLFAKLTSTPLSARAKSSGLTGFMGRIALSIAAFPVGGYLIGWIIDQLWPGSISWAITLLLLGLVVGSIYLWSWMRNPST